MPPSTHAEDADTSSESRRRRSNLKLITVEPLIAIYTIAVELRRIHIESSLAFNSTIEEDDVQKKLLLWIKLQNFNTTEENIVNYNILLWLQLQNFIVPLIMLLVLGSYSDDHKLRKPFLLMPILGEWIAMVFYIVFALFMDRFPIEVVVGVNLFLPFFGRDLLFVAAFAFLADITKSYTRTFRLGAIFIVRTICLKLCRIVGNIMDPEDNPLIIMGISLLLSLCGLAYGFFLIKEPPQEKEKSKKSLILDAFKPKHILNTFSVLKKQRLKLLVGILCLIVVRNVVHYGFYADFSWIADAKFDLVDFLNLNLSMRMIGTLSGVLLLAQLLNLDDSIILGLAFICKIASNAVFGYAKTPRMVYVASVVDIFSPLAIVILFSIVTKIVSSSDYGKILSLVAIIRITIYGLYSNEILPSPALYFGNILYSLCLPFILWLCVKYRKKEAQTLPNGPTKDDAHEIELVEVQ